MRSIADTIARLNGLRDIAMPSSGDDVLATLGRFGANPGNLAARTFIPAGLAPGAPLVVVLHGCTQSAADFDRGSGWSTLAGRHGFALLFPEQRHANNLNLCFNWFEPGDTRRGQGEPQSIADMIETLCETHALDRTRIYLTGLSAGGAMASVLLATYPELFAGAAIIAGLPYGDAINVREAFDRMRGHGTADSATLATKVDDASSHAGPRARLSIWQGTADTVVVPANLDHIAGQWQPLLGLTAAPDRIDHGANYEHRTWLGDDGTVALETIMITGMGHGVPIDAQGAEGIGTARPYMLDVGISSTIWLARAWGLMSSTMELAGMATAKPAPSRDEPSSSAVHNDPVAAVINSALRAAGLIR
jgi:poly(hydroxyalkanoate) depolymerase family esterase